MIFAVFLIFVGIALLASGTWIVGTGFIVVGAALGALLYGLRRRKFWSSKQPHTEPLVHLSPIMAVRPSIVGHKPPDGYRLASLIFGAGLIDRTETLDHGFPYQILSPIPPLIEPPLPFSTIAANRALEIAQRAEREQKQIHLLWSGGIDSTCAIAALIRALGDDRGRLIVHTTAQSRQEYPGFEKAHLSAPIRVKRIAHVGHSYSGDAIVVTGELGDQIFGSAKALTFSIDALRSDWRTAFPRHLTQALADRKRARAVLAYLKPQIDRAPVAIPDLFTLLWWLNFSMKWQSVELRMFASTRGMTLDAFRGRTEHFFATDDFQTYALAYAGQGLGRDWTTYKTPARDVIRRLTGATPYLDTKEKELSLKGLIKPRVAAAALAIDLAGRDLFQPIDLSLKKDQLAGADTTSGESDDGTGVSFDFEMNGGESNGGRSENRSFDEAREAELWNDLSDGE
ncbi:MAG: hypothetical protein AAFY53_03955 [Pseudomonadota bacterium]